MTEEPKETSQGVKRKEAPELGEDLPVSPVKKLKETHEGDIIQKFVEIKQEPQQIPIIIEPPPIPDPIATSASPKPLDAVTPPQPTNIPPTNTEQSIMQQSAPVLRAEQPQNRILSSDEEKELLEQLQNQEKSNPVLARFRRKLAIRQAKRSQGHEDKIFDLEQLITTYTNTTEKKERRLVQFYPKKQIYNYLKSMPSPKKLKSSSNGTANVNIASNGSIGHSHAIAIKKEHDPNKKPIASVTGTGNISAIKPIVPPTTVATGLAVNVKPSTANNTNVIARQATATPIGVKVPGSNAISITNQAYITSAGKTPILIPGLKPGTGVLAGNVVTAGMLTGGIVKGAGNTPIAVRVQGPGTTQVQAVTVPNALPKGNIAVVPVQVPKTGTKGITPISVPKLSTQAITAQQLIMNPKLGQGATPVQLKPVTLTAANAKMLAGVVKNPNAVAIPKTGNVVAVAGYPTITTANGKNPGSTTGQVITVGGRTAVVVPVSAAKLGQAMPNVNKPGTTTASVLSPTGRGTAIAISPSTASAIAAVTGVAPPGGVKGQPTPASVKTVPIIQAALAKTSVQSAVPVPTTAAPKQIAIQPKTATPVPLAPKPTPIAPNVKSPVPVTPVTVTPVISQPIPATVTPAVNPATTNTNVDNTKPAEASATNTNVTSKPESATNSPTTTTKTTRQITAKATAPTPATSAANQTENKNDADKPGNDKKAPVAASKKEAPKGKATSAAAAKKNNAKTASEEKEKEEKEEQSNNNDNEDDTESPSRRRTTRSSAAKAAPAASAAPKKGNSKAKKGKK